MALIKKITMKAVVGDIKKMVAADKITKPTAVARVFGTASSIATGESDYGPWVAFKGNFKAINLLDGTEYASGKLFLPEVASDLIEGALIGSEANSVEFGFDLIVAPDSESAVGYIYSAEPLIEPAGDDSLARIEKSLALPAPASAKK